MTENNSSNSNKITEFLRKQGFLMALVVCLALICTAAYFAGGTAEEPQPTNEQSVGMQKSQTLDDVVSTKEPTESAVAEPKEDTKKSESLAENTPATTGTFLTMPLDGTIAASFSGDEMVFNKTLNTWATHNGIDIVPTDSKAVLAALDGTVKQVDNSHTQGITVTIEHSDGAVTVYSGLSEATVKSGAKVKAAQTIGKVGTPAFESHIGEHLHFEYIVNGVYKDPAKYISSEK